MKFTTTNDACPNCGQNLRPSGRNGMDCLNDCTWRGLRRPNEFRRTFKILFDHEVACDELRAQLAEHVVSHGMLWHVRGNECDVDGTAEALDFFEAMNPVVVA